MTIVVLALTAACDLSAHVRAVEAVRVTGAQGRVDAVVVEASAGATSTCSYHIYLVPAGADTTNGPVVTVVGAQRSPTAYGVDLAWTQIDQVVVTYWKAKAQTPPHVRARVGADNVTVTVEPGILNPLARSGAMTTPP